MSLTLLPYKDFNLVANLLTTNDIIQSIGAACELNNDLRTLWCLSVSNIPLISYVETLHEEYQKRLSLERHKRLYITVGTLKNKPKHINYTLDNYIKFKKQTPLNGPPIRLTWPEELHLNHQALLIVKPEYCLKNLKVDNITGRLMGKRFIMRPEYDL